MEHRAGRYIGSTQFLWIALATGFALRIAMIFAIDRSPAFDEVRYQLLAKRLSEGLGYGIPFWPPGWPLVLAPFYYIFGSHPNIAVWFNLVVSVLTIALVWRLVARTFGRASAGLAAFITAILPSNLLAARVGMYEPLVQLLLVASLLLIMRARISWNCVISISLIAALLALTRPFWLLLPCVLILTSLAIMPRGTSGMSKLLASQALAVVLILPWIWYASHTAGAFVPISMNGGLNLWIGNSPEATGGYYNPGSKYWQPKRSKELAGKALEYIRGHKMVTLQRIPSKIKRMFSTDAWAVWLAGGVAGGESVWWYGSAYRIALVGHRVVMLSGLISILILAARWKLPHLFLLIIVAFHIASHIPFFGDPRYGWVVEFVFVSYAAALPLLLRGDKDSLKDLELDWARASSY